MTYRRLPAWSSGPVARAAALLALLAPAALPAAPPGADGWQYDVVILRHGDPLRGLVLEQEPDHVRVRCVTRRPGAPTVVFTRWVRADQVEHVELLGGQERDLLRRRLQGLAREREALAARLKAVEPSARGGLPPGDDELDLRPAPWPPDPRGRALAYDSRYFRLVSDARPEVVRLAAVQLEAVYAAYARTLPPRPGAAGPTAVLLLRSPAEYQAYLRARGHDLLNPAFYDAGRNEVVCACDLERLADETEGARRLHDRARAELKDAEGRLRVAYNGRVPPALLGPVEADRRRVREAEQRNAAAFARARDRLFQRLYHEAFHAYLAGFVYPPGEGEVPRWLNEGSAQIFETAVVEAGELRVGHADRGRLDAVRAALARGTFPPLADLLRAGPRQFQVAHASDREASDRHYLAAWALAFHLTFERRLLGTRALDDYVRSLGRGADPLGAFRALVGEPLPRFEEGYRQYLRDLRPDGTTKPPAK